MGTFFIFAFLASCLALECAPRDQFLSSVDLSHVSGYHDPIFDQCGIAELANDLLQNGLIGVNIAVANLGCKSLNLYGGIVDLNGTRWGPEHLTNTYSVGKGIMLATSMWIGAERGYWAWDDSVCPYWPEYCQNGKENTTVEMLASYASGVSMLNERIYAIDTKNFTKMETMIEEIAPLWVPGEGHGYAPWVIAHLVNGFVRRADPLHRRVDTFFQQEVVDRIPENLEFYTEVDPSLDPRIAHLFDPYTEFEYQYFYNLICGTPAYQQVCLGLMNPLTTPYEFNNPQIRYDTWSPSTMMYTNAESGALLYGNLAHRGALSSRGIGSWPGLRHATEEVSLDIDDFYAIFQEQVRSYTRAGWEKAQYPHEAIIDKRYRNSWVYRSGLGQQFCGMDISRQVGWCILTNDLGGIYEDRTAIYELLWKIGSCLGYEQEWE